MKPLSIECPNLTCIINQSWPGWVNMPLKFVFSKKDTKNRQNLHRLLMVKIWSIFVAFLEKMNFTSFLKRLTNSRMKLTLPYDGTKLQDWAISVGTWKWGPEAILLFHVDGCGSSKGARFTYRINLYWKIVIKNSSLLSLSLIKGAKIILSENLGKHKGSQIYITMTSRISP